MKLHIGGSRKAAGWCTFNIVAGPEVDFVGDQKDLSQFATDSVEAIYASHCLEHLGYQHDLHRALREWYRVLKPGARAYISVPDLECLCRLFLDPHFTMDQRIHVMRMMFGAQLNSHDFHYVGLTEEFLTSYLNRVGFTNVRRVEDFGIFEDTSKQRIAGVLISLNLIAHKP